MQGVDCRGAECSKSMYSVLWALPIPRAFGVVSRGQTANFFTGRYRLQYKRPGAYTASDNALQKN